MDPRRPRRDRSLSQSGRLSARTSPRRRLHARANATFARIAARTSYRRLPGRLHVTIATQLNWGASYLVADFYKRFIKPEGSQKHYVLVSRLVTVFLVICAAIVAAQLASIQAGWQWVLGLRAGTGAVYLLRWYWWRINAWSEITAMVVALITSLALRLTNPFSGTDAVKFAKSAAITTAVTTVAWLIATFMTRPVSQEVLVSFY